MTERCGSQGRESEFGGVLRFWEGVREKLGVGKDTDTILRLLDKRSKHRPSHSELFFVAEGARNLQNYGSKLHETDGNWISLMSVIISVNIGRTVLCAMPK